MGYCDTDLIYYDINKLNQYTETLRVVRPTAKQSLLMKLYQNSLYGKMVSSIHFIDGKEKNMNKDYIVIHGEHSDGSPKLGIIFKSKIAGVLKAEDGTAIILLVSMSCQYCADSYEDIVKQLV